MNVNEKQVGGNHYKTSFQHWDVLHRLGFGSEYYVGQATKYLTRWRRKHGIRDIRKGQHFVEKLIDLTKQYGPAFLMFNPPQGKLGENEFKELVIRHLERNLTPFFEENELYDRERAIITGVIFATDVESLEAVLAEIEALAIETLTTKADATGAAEDEPVSVKYDFVCYGEDHETITWRDKATGNQFTLPVDVPPGYRNP